MVDMRDLKSLGPKGPCGSDSHWGYETWRNPGFLLFIKKCDYERHLE